MTLFEAIGSLDPQVIKAYVLHHKDMAGPILCGLAFGESLVLVGLFFPATFIMVVAGLAIQQGQLDGWMVVSWSIVGAVLGDAVTYWIGRWIGPSIVHHWPLNRERSAVARARLFFRRYGFMAIFIGRFLGPVRPTIPLVGGILKMRQLTFQLANVASSIVWVPFMLFWGYLFSKALGDIGELTVGHWIALIAFVLAITGTVGWITAKVQGKGAKGKRQQGGRLRQTAEWSADEPSLAPAPVKSYDPQSRRRRLGGY